MLRNADRRPVFRDRLRYGLNRRTVKERNKAKVGIVELEGWVEILALLTKAILMGVGRSSLMSSYSMGAITLQPKESLPDLTLKMWHMCHSG